MKKQVISFHNFVTLNASEIECVYLMRNSDYVRKYCDEYKPNPKRRGLVAPWGTRYCPRCGAKGEYIGDYDSYGIQVVFECQYSGCGFRWRVSTDR